MTTDMHPRLDELLFTVQDTSFTPVDNAPDLAVHYLSVATSRSRISTSTPSPAVHRTYIEANHGVNSEGKTVLVGKVAHDLKPNARMIMKELPDQVSHRSRPATLASGLLQVNEFRKRMNAQREMMPLLLENQIPLEMSRELAMIKWNAMKPRLTVDMDHIRHYVADHKDSSIIPGLKWSQLPTENSNWWRQFLETVRTVLEEAFESDGDRTSIGPLFLGSRQRPDQQTLSGVSEYDLEVTRTRVVNFHPAFSTAFAFMPDKKGFYNEVFVKVLDLFNISDHVLFPPVDGGSTYIEFADMLLAREDGVVVLSDDLNVVAKGKHYAYDGANWETSCGVLLNDGMAATKTSFGGGLHIPSGVVDTTLDGTITNLWLYSIKRDELREGKEVEKILTMDEKDTDINFMLGFRFADDPTHPRLQGLKLMTDNSNKITPVPRGRGVLVESDYSLEEEERWTLAYYGETVEGGSILDYLSPVDGDDWVNPSRLINESVVARQVA